MHYGGKTATSPLNGALLVAIEVNQQLKGIIMKPKYFIYSQTQRDNKAYDFIFGERSNSVNYVFIGGEFIPYTEMNSTGKSNFKDAKVLGIAPNWWIRMDGVIQDPDLKKFLYSQ
jgi:hypothetical protein